MKHYVPLLTPVSLGYPLKESRSGGVVRSGSRTQVVNESLGPQFVFTSVVVRFRYSVGYVEGHAFVRVLLSLENFVSFAV
jgi:hypothetical protein